MKDYKPSPCVGSGLCCKKSPCPYGNWDIEKHQCAYLETRYEGKGFEIYRCGRYAFIRQQPGNEMVPAFGAGCCMSLGNTNRRNIIQMLVKGTDKKARQALGLAD